MSLSISPVRQRFINCCLERKHSTYELQSKIGAMNVPDHAMWLRRKLNLDLPCVLKPMVNRDGKKIKTGEYFFTPDDKRKVKAVLGLTPASPDSEVTE
jgi:hypothetical protein